MYLIELKPGKEAVYGTLDAFTDAIRRGEIGWQARIYHQAKSTWIPVTLHPHFRKLAGGRPGEMRSPPRSQWTFLPRDPGQEAGALTHGAAGAGADLPISNSDLSTPTKANHRTWRSVLGGLIGPRRN